MVTVLVWPRGPAGSSSCGTDAATNGACLRSSASASPSSSSTPRKARPPRLGPHRRARRARCCGERRRVEGGGQALRRGPRARRAKEVAT